jgi:D-alanyl-D-alanine carboxypeptidase
VAIDMNTLSNCQGCVPRMDCRVVRIFRKHGFAWGGNFRRPDGMHFEWVGQRRDQIAYPSTYCPNVVTAGATQSAGDLPTVGRSVLVEGVDELASHEHESH